MTSLVFPRTKSTRFALILAISCGQSLPSALRDAMTWFSLATGSMKIPSERVHIIVESRADAKYLLDKKVSSSSIAIVPTKAGLLSHLRALADSFTTSATKEEVDVLVSVSTHGFSNGGGREYITLGGVPVLDTELRTALIDPILKSCSSSTLRVLALLDTCASEHMLALPYGTPDGTSVIHYRSLSSKQQPLVLAMSACGDRQSDADDIGKYCGYGGGLTCAFLDACKGELADESDIHALFLKCRETLAKAGQMCILSCNEFSPLLKN